MRRPLFSWSMFDALVIKLAFSIGESSEKSRNSGYGCAAWVQIVSLGNGKIQYFILLQEIVKRKCGINAKMVPRGCF